MLLAWILTVYSEKITSLCEGICSQHIVIGHTKIKVFRQYKECL